ncbi:5-hydroxytryptamine receptor 2A-like [Strongylocentrotus purpuratus]|uniref:G-protein coupled receptors family 1 profile domain-containing protein n=1 Tax=Strongylocentrotus purpuratus TaxID=7668 RepID=A0A7M7HHQ5_STRPU|nr:5-hydroxytryptamine receptor 2A-like [Strongylocentrotus purpuratus]XP_011669145.2 5-hydroxytryptamine receptor 2A-like [Strongylocentrotus purpuratus]
MKVTMATTWTSTLHPTEAILNNYLTNNNNTALPLNTETDYNNNDVVSDGGLSWPVLLLIPIILCTIIGNLLVCLAISRDRRLHNLTNLFLFSMAIADLLVALLVMPFGLTKDLLGHWSMGLSMCDIWTTMDVFCCTSSILHMCTISIDRYLAISDPLRNKRQPRTRRGIIIKICIVWACAAGLSSPLCIMGFLQPATVLNNGQCAVTNIHFMIYGSVVAFFIPLCIVIITYCLTTYTLYKKMKLCKEGETSDMIHNKDKQKTYPRFVLQMAKRNGFEPVKDTKCDTSSIESLPTPKECRLSQSSLSSINSDNSGLKPNATHLSLRRTMSHQGRSGMKRLSTEQRASKVLGLVFTTFVVGWTPFFVANIIGALCPSCALDATVFTICTWIGWGSSMVNPFIYTAFNVRFRQAFIGLLSCNRYYTLPKRNPFKISERGRERGPDRSIPMRRKFVAYDGSMNRNGNTLWSLPEASQ